MLERLTPEAVSKQGGMTRLHHFRCPDLQSGMTESFRLSDKVFMYLDEVGALKHLPVNPRAGRIAAQCGTNLTIVGVVQA